VKQAAVRTTCPYCGVGCGLLAQPAALAASVPDEREVVTITGDPEHPANFGRLCSKAAALTDTLGLDGRLLHPRIGGERASWDKALNHVAGGFNRVLHEHGPDALAFYVSGQLLSEDYYVANKLMKGFIGSANIDTNSRLCMASAVAGHRRAFGGDLVPGCYEDLDLADLIVLVGSNAAWCHPVLFRRIEQAKQRRPQLQLVVIDPRRTPTCEIADLHVPVRSGTDVWLFAGLLAFLNRQGVADAAFVNEHTAGAAEALAAAESFGSDEGRVAQACGLDVERLRRFYRLFAATERVVTAFSQGVNQSSAGTDKVNSIINCHLLTGRIGRPGMGPFSLTGQPNAMGGREVGGMSNMLAAHMTLEDAGHRSTVQEFWGSPRIAARPGLKAVELFDAVHAGRVKAIWIMATNPVVSLPNADRVREALRRCEFVVVSDCVESTDTAALADVLLPAAAWGEKGGTVTNSERRISRQRAFLPLPGEARPDWWIVCEAAKRMGFASAFDYESPHQIFMEHARLSGADNGGSRGFDISALGGLTANEYDELAPVQWPLRGDAEHRVREGRPQERARPGTPRLFGDGRFWHPDGKARFIPTPPRGPAHVPAADFPLVLNTGRIRDQWHSMTRTGRSPRLAEHLGEPFVDLHAHDALLAGVRTGELAWVQTRWGSLVARVRTSGEIARGAAFVPIHWSSQNSSEGRVGVLVSPSVDPLSGEPEFKHTPASIEPFVVDWYGFVLTREAIDAPDFAWWTAIRCPGFWRYEIAGRAAPCDTRASVRKWVRAFDTDADYIEYRDDAAGIYRAAHIVDDRLEACVYLSARPDLPPRDWLSGLFAHPRLEERVRTALLVGQPAGPRLDPGPLVCSCFGVGRNALCDAIAKHDLKSTQEVGARVRAGTNCGSCLPEIARLLPVAT